MVSVDIKKIIDGMTLDQKIAHMWLGGVAAGETLDQAKRNIEKIRFGGFSFSYHFQRFIRGGNYLPCGISQKIPIEQTAEFLYELKKAALEIMGVPLLPACDQEGGMEESEFRRDPVVLTPNQMGVGAAGSLEDAYNAATISARQLKAIGIDMFLGPCLDVNSNPKNPEIAHRSFGDEAAFVAERGEQVIKAYRQQGIITTAKHFAGRGNSDRNAHSELDVLDMDREHFDAVEFVPFRRAIAAGVETVMLAHTIYPALGDDKLPASMSPTIIRKVLREELGFKGIVYTDDMTMFAISKNYGIPEACAMAIEAGCDLLLMKVNKLIPTAVEAVKKRIAAGRIKEENINESLERLLNLKLKYGLFEGPEFSAEKVRQNVGTPEIVETGRRLARRAALVLKNEGDIFPLKPHQYESPLVIVPRNLSVAVSNDPLRSHDMLAGCVRRFFPGAFSTVFDQPPTEHQLYELRGLVNNADLIVFGMYAIRSAEGQKDSAAPLIQVLDLLSEYDKPIVALLSGAPYLAERVYDRVRGIVCSFSISPLTLEAAVDLICGKIQPHAKLPVHVSDRLPRGFSVPVASA